VSPGRAIATDPRPEILLQERLDLLEVGDTVDRLAVGDGGDGQRAGRVAGESDHLERCALGREQGGNREKSVAGADPVHHLAGHGRDLDEAAGGVAAQTAVLAPGDDQPLASKLPEDVPREVADVAVPVPRLDADFETRSGDTPCAMPAGIWGAT